MLSKNRKYRPCPGFPNTRSPGGEGQHLVINTGNTSAGTFSFLGSQSSTGPASVEWMGNSYWNGNGWTLGNSNAAYLAGAYQICIPQ